MATTFVRRGLYLDWKRRPEPSATYPSKSPSGHCGVMSLRRALSIPFQTTGHGFRLPLWGRFFAAFVLLAMSSSVLAGIGTAWLWGRHVRQRQEEELQKVAGLIARSTFPLHRVVLMQMRDLSGVEFVTLGPGGTPLESTLALTEQDHSTLAHLVVPTGQTGPQRFRLRLGGKNYQAMKVALVSRASLREVEAVVLLREEAALWAELFVIVPATSLAAGCALLLSAAVSWWLSRSTARPLVELARATVRATEEWSTPIPIPRPNNELRDLALAIRQMIRQRQEFERALREQERKHALHELGLGLSHQLRNMVTALRLALELHAEACPLAKQEGDFDVVFRQLQAMEVALREFLTFSTQVAVVERVSIPEVLAEVLEFLRPAFSHSRVECRIEPCATQETSCVVRGHRFALFQLISNLVTNALEAAREAEQSPTVFIRLERDGNWGRLVVQDNGRGIPPDVQERLFKSPVTNKRDGIGLGLLVCQLVAEQHGGQLAWSRHHGLTEFVFRFPVENDGGEGVCSDSRRVCEP